MKTLLPSSTGESVLRYDMLIICIYIFLVDLTVKTDEVTLSFGLDSLLQDALAGRGRQKENLYKARLGQVGFQQSALLRKVALVHTKAERQIDDGPKEGRRRMEEAVETLEMGDFVEREIDELRRETLISSTRTASEYFSSLAGPRNDVEVHIGSRKIAIIACIYEHSAFDVYLLFEECDVCVNLHFGNCLCVSVSEDQQEIRLSGGRTIKGVHRRRRRPFFLLPMCAKYAQQRTPASKS